MGFLSRLLGVVSGNSGLKVSDQLLFDKIIGFRGVVPGVGTSTIVQNTAIALSERTNFSICVLDTSFMYPTQYPMLISTPDSKHKDFLEFNGDLSEVALPTSYRNVTLISLSNRTVVDMLTSKDNEITVEKLIASLKSFFDVILVDLSAYELTSITTHTAIKCNRIFNVTDQSLKSLYHLRKSLNTMATLAVPLAKANKVIINKTLPDVLTNSKGVIEEAGLEVVGEIPISLEIAKQGLTGKRLWATTTSSKDIFAFSEVINRVVDDIIQATPLNAKYIDEKEVALAKEKEKTNTVIVEEPVEEHQDTDFEIATTVSEDKSFFDTLEESKAISNETIVEEASTEETALEETTLEETEPLSPVNEEQEKVRVEPVQQKEQPKPVELTTSVEQEETPKPKEPVTEVKKVEEVNETPKPSENKDTKISNSSGVSYLDDDDDNGVIGGSID